MYAELGRAAGSGLASWDQAFRPHDYLALMEPVGAQWRPWHLVLPRRPGEPGTGSDPVTPWQMTLEALTWLRRWQSEVHARTPHAAPPAPEAGFDALLSP